MTFVTKAKVLKELLRLMDEAEVVRVWLEKYVEKDRAFRSTIGPHEGLAGLVEAAQIQRDTLLDTALRVKHDFLKPRAIAPLLGAVEAEIQEFRKILHFWDSAEADGRTLVTEHFDYLVVKKDA